MNMLINNNEVSMEIDTGASVSIISENTYESVFTAKPQLCNFPFSWCQAMDPTSLDAIGYAICS